MLNALRSSSVLRRCPLTKPPQPKMLHRLSGFGRSQALRGFGSLRWLSTTAAPPKIHIFESQCNSILFNLATEEWVLEAMELEGPAMFLWRNSKTVSGGKAAAKGH